MRATDVHTVLSPRGTSCRDTCTARIYRGARGIQGVSETLACAQSSESNFRRVTVISMPRITRGVALVCYEALKIKDSRWEVSAIFLLITVYIRLNAA